MAPANNPDAPVYPCPYCEHSLQQIDLEQPAGLTGGMYCPKCHGRVYLTTGLGKYVAAASFAIGFTLLWLFHVRSIATLIIGTVVLALPISLFLNFESARFRPVTLRKWRERESRTFFEWLYERNSPRSPRNRD